MAAGIVQDGLIGLQQQTTQLQQRLEEFHALSFASMAHPAMDLLSQRGKELQDLVVSMTQRMDRIEKSQEAATLVEHSTTEQQSSSAVLSSIREHEALAQPLDFAGTDRWNLQQEPAIQSRFPALGAVSEERESVQFEDGAGHRVASLVNYQHWSPRPLKEGDEGIIIQINYEQPDSFFVDFGSGLEGWLGPGDITVVDEASVAEETDRRRAIVHGLQSAVTAAARTSAGVAGGLDIAATDLKAVFLPERPRWELQSPSVDSPPIEECEPHQQRFEVAENDRLTLQHEIESCRQKLISLRQELTMTQDSAGVPFEEYESLQRKFESLDMENASLKQELEVLISEMAAQELPSPGVSYEEYDALRQQFEALRNEALSADSIASPNPIGGTRGGVSCEENELLRQQLEMVTVAHATLRQQIADLENGTSRQELTQTPVIEGVSFEEHEALRQHFETLNLEHAALNEKLEQAIEEGCQMALVVASAESAAADAEALRQQFDHLNADNTMLRERLAQAEEQGRESKINSARTVAPTETMMADTTAVRQQLEAVSSENATLKEKLAHLEEEGRRRDVTVASAESLMASTDALRQLEAVNSENSMLKEKLAHLEEESRRRDVTVASAESLMASTDALRQQADALSHENAALKEKLAHLEEEGRRREVTAASEESLMASTDALRQLEAVSFENAALKEKLAHLEEEGRRRDVTVASAESLMASTDALRQQADALSQENVLLNEQLAATTEKSSSASFEIDRLLTALDISCAESEANARAVADEKEKMRLIRITFETQITELEEGKTREIENLTSEKDTLGQQLSEVQREMQAAHKKTQESSAVAKEERATRECAMERLAKVANENEYLRQQLAGLQNSAPMAEAAEGASKESAVDPEQLLQRVEKSMEIDVLRTAEDLKRGLSTENSPDNAMRLTPPIEWSEMQGKLAALRSPAQQANIFDDQSSTWSRLIRPPPRCPAVSSYAGVERKRASTPTSPEDSMSVDAPRSHTPLRIPARASSPSRTTPFYSNASSIGVPSPLLSVSSTDQLKPPPLPASVGAWRWHNQATLSKSSSTPASFLVPVPATPPSASNPTTAHTPGSFKIPAGSIPDAKQPPMVLGTIRSPGRPAPRTIASYAHPLRQTLPGRIVLECRTTPVGGAAAAPDNPGPPLLAGSIDVPIPRQSTSPRQRGPSRQTSPSSATRWSTSPVRVREVSGPTRGPPILAATIVTKLPQAQREHPAHKLLCSTAPAY